MDPPGGRDERQRQEERLRREEAYYQFIDGLSEDEYRLMRDSNLLGTPGEVTAEELRQRLDGAKERLSAQPAAGAGPPAEEDTSSGSPDAPGESSGSDSLLEWLNTFRRTGNATRSGQSGNQTWRAVSRTNPNSGEFRFSLEININHEQPEGAEAGEPADLRLDPGSPPASRPAGRAHLHRRAPGPSAARRTEPPQEPPAGRGRSLRRGEPPEPPAPAPAQPWRVRTSGGRRGRTRASPQTRASEEQAADARAGLDCPRVRPDPEQRGDEAPAAQPRRSRTRARGRARADSAQRGAARSAASRRSRSPLRSEPSDSVPAAGRQGEGVGTTAGGLVALGGSAMAVDEPVREQGGEPPAPLAGAAPEAGAEDTESHSSASGGVRRHPTIMLDLQVRRIRPGENRDRDSIASRTRSRVRMAENTVTFESDSGGFRRTISRSERAGIRTYVSTIRIPLRRISETGLGEPSSTALRSILRQIMTGFGELSSLMETEADSEAAGAGLDGNPAVQAFRLHGDEGAAAAAQGQAEPPPQEGAGARGLEERLAGGAHSQLLAQPGEGRPAGRDTNNLVENGTLPILRLAHFFLLNDDEDEEHPRGLTKEQIDNLSTRTYGQASLEGELGRACSVCINEYAQGNKLRRLPCAHEFHIHCIDRWLSENNTCPICRQPVLHPHHV